MHQWTLVFHVLGLVFWVGSLLVVTHLLAIHSEESALEAREALGRVEMRLLKALAHPGGALMVITGVILILTNREYYLRAVWLHAKLFLVVVLVVLDILLYRRAKAFLTGERQLDRRQCMMFHGAIAVVFTAILILVIIKPL